MKPATKIVLILLIAFQFYSHSLYSQGEVVITNIQSSQLTTYMNQIGNNGTIIVKGNITINSGTTIPEGIVLNFYKGNKIILNTAYTLTINGVIDAGLFQIFEGDGIIAGKPKIDYIYPQWFGAVSDNSSINSTTAVQKAINASIDLSIPVKLTTGSYYVNELYINNDLKPFKIIGEIIDTEGQIHGTTMILKDPTTYSAIFNLGYNGSQLTRSRNVHIEGINFRASRNHLTTYAIKGGQYSDINFWVQRVTIQNCTFSEFDYGIYLGGYSDGLSLSHLKFETVERCIYVVQADGSRISNIVAEPYLDYVLHSVKSMGLVFSDAILRGTVPSLETNLTVPFIIEGSKGDAGSGYTIDQSGPIKIENIHIETSNGIAKIANAESESFPKNSSDYK